MIATVNCDPCRFCVNLGTDRYSYENGWEYGECGVDAEFEGDGRTPCPMFRARLVSDDLLQQISDEEEYRFYSTCDCKKTDCTGCQWDGDCDTQEEREEEINCDPCRFCVNLGTDRYSYENGWEYGECGVDAEFEGDGRTPCPMFRARLVSDDLYEQLFVEEEEREEEERQHITSDCKRTDCSGCKWDGNCGTQEDRIYMSKWKEICERQKKNTEWGKNE